MIDGRKIFPDVAFEHVAIKLQKMLIAANSAMGAFSDAISIRIKDMTLGCSRLPAAAFCAASSRFSNATIVGKRFLWVLMRCSIYHSLKQKCHSEGIFF